MAAQTSLLFVEAWPEGAPGAGADPVGTMRSAHVAKLRLCETLEQVADALPDAVDRVLCLRVAAELAPFLRAVHRFEEQRIFPAYEAARALSAASPTARLRAEHFEDECFADDVTDTLLQIGRGGAVANPEATGFMLRGFFETLRRHIAFEAEHILPLIEESGRE